jgi:hypothetical protein
MRSNAVLVMAMKQESWDCREGRAALLVAFVSSAVVPIFGSDFSLWHFATVFFVKSGNATCTIPKHSL